jgi:hypothetical protein
MPLPASPVASSWLARTWRAVVGGQGQRQRSSEHLPAGTAIGSLQRDCTVTGEHNALDRLTVFGVIEVDIARAHRIERGRASSHARAAAQLDERHRVLVGRETRFGVVSVDCLFAAQRMHGLVEHQRVFLT